MTHVKTSLYWAVFWALVVCTAATVGASYVDLGRAGNIALGTVIAIFKACLVGAIFMHLKFERGWIYFFVFFPLVLFLIVVFALMPDIGMGWNQP
jgi:cytochrome c oxidase subunit 4